ncbi:hypothetical protein P3T76_011223 [Phytophthora citrophthora]|uniref:Uncharacterized protein n=1 Tax=Phytophthora citrophthora TaxID=4793 RepID=A0AAD9LGM4_9STRA|nr:hypothetical protein P3T76_011223 [Phytophthora citrophthora]
MQEALMTAGFDGMDWHNSLHKSYSDYNSRLMVHQVTLHMYGKSYYISESKVFTLPRHPHPPHTTAERQRLSISLFQLVHRDMK